MIRSMRKHLSFANVMACFAVFIALGGSAYAVGKNTIGSKQLKNNAVTAKKIKKNAVTAQKIKKNAVSSAKIKGGAITSGKIADGAVTGPKVDVASLGQVPSAANADTAGVAAEAGSLVGQENFFVKLDGGENAVIAQYGVVALRAFCVANEGGDDYIRIYAETTQNGAILAGDTTLNGGPAPADFLNTDTPEPNREFEEESTTTGETFVDSEIDSGFVLGPDGKAIIANSEGIIMGLNYLDSRCITGGVINYIDAPQ